MTDLFDYPHVRTDDVDTSHEAVPVNITAQALRVLKVYRDGSALLDEGAYERAGMRGHQRCSDLRHVGFIERIGTKARMPSRKLGHLCCITQAGLDYLAEHG